MTRPGFGGVQVPIPDDFAEAVYFSDYGKLSLHRLEQKETVHVHGNPETRIARKDPIQFVEGVFPGPGHTLTPQEYAELETHPFKGRKFDRLSVPEPIEPPTTIETADTDALLEQLRERAASGDRVAKAAIEAMEPKTGGGSAQSKTAKKKTSTRKRTAPKKTSTLKKTTANKASGTSDPGTSDPGASGDGPTTLDLSAGGLQAAAEAVIAAGAEASDLAGDDGLDKAKILAAAEAHGIVFTGLED